MKVSTSKPGTGMADARASSPTRRPCRWEQPLPPGVCRSEKWKRKDQKFWISSDGIGEKEEQGCCIASLRGQHMWGWSTKSMSEWVFFRTRKI
ncbi:hypothetical protein BRADI_1g03951v3 [Brachypodium distachyon]|uniref:Uncharacterized protein n=1 Tax=Brachypodium distachyon TaxID=15368 RepID=A0A2K2DHY8_BRADI|nr:hypothetical protein BRADI_1g03951v3 [Brachypodium distachyon]